MFEGESRPRWMADRRRCRSLVVSPGPAVQVASCQVPSSQCEAEVDEASQVDRGAAVGEPDPVAGDAAVADLAAAAAHEPGDGSFDHRAVLSVGVGELGGEGVGAGGGEQVVVLVDLERCVPVAEVVQRCAQRAAVGSLAPKVAEPVRLIRVVIPFGQVAVVARSCRS